MILEIKYLIYLLIISFEIIKSVIIAYMRYFLLIVLCFLIHYCGNMPENKEAEKTSDPPQTPVLIWLRSPDTCVIPADSNFYTYLIATTEDTCAKLGMFPIDAECRVGFCPPLEIRTLPCVGRLWVHCAST